MIEKRPQGRPREFCEQQVLTQALEVFWESGFESTSLDDLLQRTGIGRQSLYRTFGNKRALFLRALESYGEICRAHLRETVLEASSPLAGLHALLDGWQADADKDCCAGCFNLNTLGELAGREDPEMRALVIENFEILEETVQTALRRAADAGEITLRRAPEEIAHSFLGASIALSQLGRAGLRPEIARHVIDGVRAEIQPRSA